MARPTSVTVFSVLNLIGGGVGVFGIAFFALIKLGMIDQSLLMKDPIYAYTFKLMEENTPYWLFSQVSAYLGMVATVLIIAASIGMLQLKSWARLLTIGWGGYCIFMAIVGLVISLVMVYGPMLAQASDEQTIVKVTAGKYGAIGGSIVFVGYWVLMIAVLGRNKVRLAFAQSNNTMEPAL